MSPTLAHLIPYAGLLAVVLGVARLYLMRL